MNLFIFNQELEEGIIEQRKTQFTMLVNYKGKSYKSHCPTTGRVGNLTLEGCPCLLSKSSDIKRKTTFTVEAISLNHPEDKHKNWIGINQTAVNRYVEYFLKKGSFSKMLGEVTEIKEKNKALEAINNCKIYREQTLGNSRLDFLVGDTFIEVKTPLQYLQVNIPSYVKTKKIAPFSGTDRMTKHITELGNSLEIDAEKASKKRRAIMLLCFIYDNPGFKVIEKSTHYEEVKEIVEKNMKKGVEIWQANFQINSKGVKLKQYFRIEVL